MEEIITGYQWGDTQAFIGEYEFPRNLDSESIHLPPRTSLLAPPAPEDIPSDQEAAWDGEAWFLRDKVV